MDSLTTERLRKFFKNNFDLCNFSIAIGRELVLRGDASSLSQVLDAVEDQAEDRQSEEQA